MVRYVNDNVTVDLNRDSSVVVVVVSLSKVLTEVLEGKHLEGWKLEHQYYGDERLYEREETK